jgi:hypothetical protein
MSKVDDNIRVIDRNVKILCFLLLLAGIIQILFWTGYLHKIVFWVLGKQA